MFRMNILMCGGDPIRLERAARMLTDEGVRVETTVNLTDRLLFSTAEWDLLIVDLDGLNSFLRTVLPAVRRQFTELPIIGMSRNSEEGARTAAILAGLELDGYISGLPRPETLIVRLPQIATKFLCDTGSLEKPPTGPLPSD